MKFDIPVLRYLRPARFLVQAIFGLFMAYAGYRFLLFFRWATEDTAYIPRPAAVEAFLPISALLGLKRLIFTGSFDMIHPTGLTIFLAALCISFFFRKGFCGWICPVGFASNLAERAGRKWGMLLHPPLWLDYALSSIKYLFLFFFIAAVFLRMDLPATELFLRSPYNLAADARMLNFFLHPSRLTTITLLLLTAGSFFIPNFWCRYFCPYGALLGLFASAGPTRITRNEAKCIACRACEDVCPAVLRIAEKKTIRHPDCIGCMACISICPQEGCLENSFAGKTILPLLVPFGAVAVFLTFWLVARLSGHWETSLTPIMFKKLYLLTAKIMTP